jgi:hypothetical protein
MVVYYYYFRRTATRLARPESPTRLARHESPLSLVSALLSRARREYSE